MGCKDENRNIYRCKNVKRIDIKDKSPIEECLKTYRYPGKTEQNSMLLTSIEMIKLL
jgi:hypothetical protein